jgi:hypothetical protein
MTSYEDSSESSLSFLNLFTSSRSKLKRKDSSPAAWTFNTTSLSPPSSFSQIQFPNNIFDSFDTHAIKILVKALESSQRNYKVSKIDEISILAENLFCFLFDLCLDKPSKRKFNTEIKDDFTENNYSEDVQLSYYLS